MMASSKTILSEWFNRIQSPAAVGVVALRSVRNRTSGTDIGDAITIADKGAVRRKGLLAHTELLHGEGLWIVPCEAVHTFFMKFDLDLIYLDRSRKVVKVCSSVPAWRLSFCFKAHSILELPVGTIQATKTRVGDAFEITTVYTQ